jgi:hypothetical protein
MPVIRPNDGHTQEGGMTKRLQILLAVETAKTLQI